MRLTAVLAGCGAKSAGWIDAVGQIPGVTIIGSADLDLARAQAAVYCREWNPQSSWSAQGSSAAAIFEMTGDVIFTYVGSWCAKSLGTSWESAWRIVCERGTLIWDGHDNIRAAIAEAPRERLFDTDTPLRCRRFSPATTSAVISACCGISWRRCRAPPRPRRAARTISKA